MKKVKASVFLAKKEQKNELNEKKNIYRQLFNLKAAFHSGMNAYGGKGGCLIYVSEDDIYAIDKVLKKLEEELN